MNWSEFRKAGHWPTLLSAFLYFDMGFMAWVMLGPLAAYLSKALSLPAEDMFTLVAIPILSGAAFRIPMGMMADHFGPKRTGMIGQVVVMAGLAYAWVFGLHSSFEVMLLGIVLGVAGASFAVALPQASRWYPPKYQGIVMGIAGAGNSGVMLGSLFIPTLAEMFGHQDVFGLMLIPLGLVFVIYALTVKDAPDKRAPVTVANYTALLRDRDTWWFMFFYFITFGGFVGLAGAMPLYFKTWYSASGVAAGLMAAIVVFGGSFCRPLGGWIADRIGGLKALQVLYTVVALAYLTIAFLPQGPAPSAEIMAAAKVGGWALADLPGIAWIAVAVFFVGAMGLGMGNGSVFQLVPLRFRKEIGVITGLVGAGGGLGGFFLAKALGMSKDLTGAFTVGFCVFAGLSIVGLIGIISVKTRWRTTWGAASGATV
jgi:NNP family nitrate/nitrite transporter-like MFS transporter